MRVRGQEEGLVPGQKGALAGSLGFFKRKQQLPLWSSVLLGSGDSSGPGILIHNDDRVVVLGESLEVRGVHDRECVQEGVQVRLLEVPGWFPHGGGKAQKEVRYEKSSGLINSLEQRGGKKVEREGVEELC